jgi:hypothetical protein
MAIMHYMSKMGERSESLRNRYMPGRTGAAPAQASRWRVASGITSRSKCGS